MASRAKFFILIGVAIFLAGAALFASPTFFRSDTTPAQIDAPTATKANWNDAPPTIQDGAIFALSILVNRTLRLSRDVSNAVAPTICIGANLTVEAGAESVPLDLSSNAMSMLAKRYEGRARLVQISRCNLAAGEMSASYESIPVWLVTYRDIDAFIAQVYLEYGHVVPSQMKPRVSLEPNRQYPEPLINVGNQQPFPPGAIANSDGSGRIDGFGWTLLYEFDLAQRNGEIFAKRLSSTRLVQ
jgi:hypothetical protein